VITKGLSGSLVSNLPAVLIGWDRDTEVAAGIEHPRGLVHDALQIVQVHQHHERDDEIARAVLDRKRARVRLRDLEQRLSFTGGFHERRRRVERANVVAALLQVPCQSALTTADVESQAARRRQQFEKAVAVEAPVGVVTRLACPMRPVGGVTFPVFAQ
jgi:hypothetical protein